MQTTVSEDTLTLSELLVEARARHASDLHVTSDLRPIIRIFGELHRLEDYPPLSGPTVEKLALAHVTDRQRARFDASSELDFTSDIDGVARVRGNVFRQRGLVAAVFRMIPDRIPSLADLGLPAAILPLSRKPRGLVLVTGPTGCGKTTTLAAMIDAINAESRRHILTIEDPIEFVHEHKKSVISQREIHADTEGFQPALRAALREDPDVVFIGEMRDQETVEATLRVAETGHLTLATLHTNSAVQSVHRIIDFFPAHQHAQVRSQLSLVLQGVVSQILIPRLDQQGLVAAVEVLVPTAGVRHLIREGKLHQLYSSMQSSAEAVGMQTMNQALASLCRRRLIGDAEAVACSSHPDELQDMLTRRPHR